MNHLNFSCVLVAIGIWVSTEVRGEMRDTAVIVRKLVSLGRAADMPANTAAAIGEDSIISYDQNRRRELCDRMQSSCVIELVRNSMNHHSNTLSGEDPGETKIFAVCEDGEDKMDDKNIVGFQCKAKVDDGSKSFVVILYQHSPLESGYVAYVPREYVLDEVV